MTYGVFLEEVNSMLSKFPESKLLVPTLGGRSLFLIYVENGKLKIVNSKGKTYAFTDKEYNAIQKRFVESPAFVAFKTCNYTKTTNAGCIGWTTQNGNKNWIYWGYLPAVFRELYARNEMCIGNSYLYNSPDMRSYTAVEWKDFLSYIKIRDIISSISYNDINFDKKVELSSFLNAKKKVCDFFVGNNWGIHCVLWSNIADTVEDETLRYIVLIILKWLRKEIIKCFKKWKDKKGKNKYPRRNCNKCPRNKNYKH